MALIAGLPVFIVFCFLVFYFPGRILLAKKAGKLKTEEVVSISFILGFILFVVVAVLLGMVNLRFLSLPLYIFLFLYALPRYAHEFWLNLKTIFSNKKLLLILILGIIVQVIINFPSGFKYQQGVLFWSSQGHDGLWHVALMEEISKHFPPSNPLYPGHSIINYHYASDILMGEFYRLFPFFGSLNLYFRYYPILFSFLIGLGVFAFAAHRWNKSVGYWSMFFAYFCSSFGYIYLATKGAFIFGGETAFWASQNNTILGNPPHTLGIILITNFLIVLRLFFKSRDWTWLILGFFMTFFLSVFKVSAGAVLIAGLAGSGLFYFIKEKRLDLPLFGLVLAVSNFGMLKFISPTAESFLHFEPLWFSRTMMVAKLDNVDWELRRQHYLSINTLKSWLRVIQLEGTALAVFIIGNTGARVVGFLAVLKSIYTKKADYVDVFLVSGLFGALLVPIFFVQKGITYNLIQFMQIYFHFLGFFAALFAVRISKLLKNRYQKIAFFLAIIVLAIPGTIGSFFDFYGPGHHPLAVVSNSELEALSWLKDNTQEDQIVLTMPFNGNAKYRYNKLPLPISAWYSTPYQYVFSERYGFLTGEEQLEITGYDYKTDLENARQFFKQLNSESDRRFLEVNKIGYIYLRKDEIETPLGMSDVLDKVFENDETEIYKVD